MSVVTKKKVTLEYLQAHPETLESAWDDRKGVSDILEEIYNRTNTTYEDLGRMLEIAPNSVGRVIRHLETTVNEKTLLRLSHAMKIPFSTLVYRNTLERLRKTGDEHITTMLRTIEEEPQILETYVLDAVNIPMLAAYNEASAQERRAMLSQFSKKTKPTVSLPAPVSGESIFIRQNGDHMMTIPRRGTVVDTDMQVVIPRQIPPGAIVEIELVPELKQIKNDDIVFVQLGKEPASCYVYRRERAGEGLYETFSPINAHTKCESATTHVVSTLRKRPQDILEKRIIYGRALRIVHIDLTRLAY